MKKTLLLLATATLAASLFGSSFLDSLVGIAQEVVKTNVVLFTGQQAAATSNRFAKAAWQTSLDTDLTNTTAFVSNTLNRALGVQTSAETAATTATNAATTAAATTATNVTAATTAATSTVAVVTTTATNTADTAARQTSDRPKRFQGFRPKARRRPSSGEAN